MYIAYMRFQGASTSEVIGARNERFLRSWPVISGDVWGLSFPDIYLRVEEKLRKKPQPGRPTRPGIEPGPARCDNDVTPRPQSSGRRHS